MKLIDLLPADAVRHGRWWGKPLSLVDGCTHVSRGCDRCWAEAMAARFQSNEVYGAVIRDRRWNNRLRIGFGPLMDMYNRRKPTVYAVWNDLFHEQVPDEFIGHAIAMFRAHSRHVFIVCTKRPERMAEFSQSIGGFPPNVIAMTSAEDQATADERIPWLLRTQAHLRAVNVEPMLGPVDLTAAADITIDKLEGIECPAVEGIGAWIQWVLCGGETGLGARVMMRDWAVDLRDQCRVANVPFWFKHWGTGHEWYEELTDCRDTPELPGR